MAPLASPDALDVRYLYTRIVAAQLDPEEGIRSIHKNCCSPTGSGESGVRIKILESEFGNPSPYAFALLLEQLAITTSGSGIICILHFDDFFYGSGSEDPDPGSRPIQQLLEKFLLRYFDGGMLLLDCTQVFSRGEGGIGGPNSSYGALGSPHKIHTTSQFILSNFKSS